MSSNRSKLDTKSSRTREKGSILTIKNPDHNKFRSKSPMSSKYQAQERNKTDRGKSAALERWQILKEAILDKSTNYHHSNVSVRRFDSFGFVKCIQVPHTVKNSNLKKNYSNKNPNGSSHRYYNSNKKGGIDDVNSDSDDDEDVCVGADKTSKNQESAENYEWYNISVPSIESMDSVKVRFYKGPIGLKEMSGFNNTGNVCLWPSEEIMTYFCIKNSAIFDDKSVCELGGGMTCLGGLMISRFSEPNEVFLTDGNEFSFENLEVICSDNEFRCSVECCLLQWSKETNYGDLENRFDYIICADCLFFDEFREDLCATIWKLLKMEGTCLIFAPNRQNSFHKFVDMAKLHFECMIVHDYDMEVWERHLYEKENNPNYDEDLHYPLLLKLKKRKKTTNDFCKMVL